jgi:hypothetical protein
MSIYIPYFDHLSGAVSAPVVVVEYGDLLCPHCGDCYVEMKILHEMLGGHLLFVFRHFFPFNLCSISLDAAVACEVAGAQRKFWYMHDIIFENQRYLSRSALSRFGSEVGVDMSPFKDTRTNINHFEYNTTERPSRNLDEQRWFIR